MKKIHILISLAISTILFSCATQKKRGEKTGPIGRLYHNTTAHYNGYFNANVLYNESIANLNDQHQDNYTKILDLYKYAAADNPQSVAEQLDEAIKKVSVVVSLHRQSKWTDDCYLLFGKSHYAKQDYEAAEETFAYLIEEFSPEAMEARKNKGKKKKKKHKKVKKKKSSKKKVSKKDKKVKKKKPKKEKIDKSIEGQRKRKEKEKKELEAKKAEMEAKAKAEREALEKGISIEPKPVAKTEVKKSKIKDGEKPKKYFLKHRPTYQQGMLWLARTYIERSNFDDAQTIISRMERDSKTEKKVRRELAAVKAYYFLKQKAYQNAIEPLEEAIKLSRKKKEKARYAYIIAQIHQQEGNQTEAYAYFKKALKYRPTYDMEFRSRLNLALSSWLNGTSTADAAKKDLKKMLKEGKNSEYKDQIYYTIAEISLKNNDKEEAIENLLLSLQNNAGNQTQRGESYLKLADLYYDAEEYVDAKYYYDSTLTVVTNTDERFDRITRFSDNLTEIAANIMVIEMQDSLLTIAQLPEDEKRALALKLKKEQAKAGVATAGVSKPGNLRLPPRVNTPGRTSSNFFAYDDRKVKKGKRDFEKVWGDRKLEDNWRKSSKTSSLEIDENEGGELSLNKINDDEVAKILSDVPNSADDIAAANDEIAAAMFNLGRLFYEKLQNYPKSVSSLEGLFKRYPKNEHELDAWYYLYLSHDALKEPALATSYTNKICKKYPESNYCNILQNPDFLQANKDKANKLVSFYNATYNAFDNGQYKKAYERITKSNQEFGNTHEMMPKFALLKAMCIGNLEGKDAYINSLKEVIGKYPDSDEERRAKEIIRLLSGGADVAEDSGKTDPNSKFKLENDKVHYCITVINGDKIKLTDAKGDVADFNRKYHSLSKLRISNIYLGADTNLPILVIRRFKDKTEAMVYYDGVQKNKQDFLGKNDNYEVFAVTQHNYREILKSKSLDGYREFFEDNYK